MIFTLRYFTINREDESSQLAGRCNTPCKVWSKKYYRKLYQIIIPITSSVFACHHCANRVPQHSSCVHISRWSCRDSHDLRAQLAQASFRFVHSDSLKFTRISHAISILSYLTHLLIAWVPERNWTIVNLSNFLCVVFDRAIDSA